MPAILSKALWLGALFVSAALSGRQLGTFIIWDGYTAFAQEVTQGRTEPADIVHLAPITQGSGGNSCATLRDTPLITLNLYALDLLVRQTEDGSSAPTDNRAFQTQLAHTRMLLEEGLACAPMNGDLWLSLALVSRAMGDPPEMTADFLGLSERYAPHEGWIAGRRAQFF